MGTFSKSLASCGGFIASSHEVVDFLRVQSRAYMFTAAGVPAATGAALAALRIVRSEEGPQLFARVLENARYLNRGLHDLGFKVVEPLALPDGSTVITPIVPVLVGDDWKAVLLWRALYDAGVYVNVALHPAVAPRRRAAAHERHGDPRPRRCSTARSHRSNASSPRSSQSTDRCPPRRVSGAARSGIAEIALARGLRTYRLIIRPTPKKTGGSLRLARQVEGCLRRSGTV